MSLKEHVIELIRDPETDKISKSRVGIFFFIVILAIACTITGISQIHKRQYLAEQQAKMQQRRSQASNIPMATNSDGEKIKQYVSTQTKIKNQYARTGIQSNGFGDPLAVNTGESVPPIVATNNGAVKLSTGIPNNIQQGTLQETSNRNPIEQEYQNEKLDKIKHNYAAYRADTLVGPQTAHTNSSQPSRTEHISQENSPNIPQPQLLSSNAQQPSNGYIKAATNGSDSVSNSTGDNTNGSEQNMQNEKNNFLKNGGKDNFNDDYVNAAVKDPISRFEIKAGTPIPGFMITSINSDLPGVVTAQVGRNIYDTKTGNYLLIPGGSRLIGVYDSNIAYGQGRVMVAWNRVIFPSGASYRLYGMPGTDMMGVSGVTGDINSHYGRIYGSAMVMGVITAGMQYSQNTSNPNVQAGATYPNPTAGQSLASGLGQQLGQAGLQVTQKNLNVQPTIEIPASQKINIMLTADVVLRPINKQNYMGDGGTNVNRN